MYSFLQTSNLPTVEQARDIFNIQIHELESVRDRMGPEVISAAELIYRSKGRVVVTGIGKSGLVGKKIAATLASTGTHAMFMNAAEGLHGDLGMIERDDVVVAISNSGNSDEVLALLPSIQKIGAKIIAMTGNKNSVLGQAADIVLDVGVQKEACPLNLAPTSSATVTLVMGDTLAIMLMKMRNFQPEDFALYHPGGTLGRRLLTRVRDVMHSDDAVPRVTVNATIEDIVYEISSKRLGAVCVMDLSDPGKMVGIITDGDVRRAINKYKQELFLLDAAHLMTTNFRNIGPDQMAVDALNVMEKHKISSLPVIDQDQLVGLITIHDVFNIR